MSSEADQTVVDPEAASGHMAEFADRTGLTSDRPQNRYLWTDAFAVFNWVGLWLEFDETVYLERAGDLVDAVHRTLGQYREDDEREGWLSGLEGEEAENHPTRGGLRIGKEKPERPQGAPMNRREEWDRDGQYFHYLTKWMQALDLLAWATGEADYNRWARELAEAARQGFVYREAGVPQMYWKMRTDLSEPLVPTMGQHDPLEGYTTYRQLRASADRLEADDGPDLGPEVDVFEEMVVRGDWSTTDPLGLGGLLLNLRREADLAAAGSAESHDLLGDLLDAAAPGLAAFARSGRLRESADRRLAFRELGLAVGLHAIETLRRGEDSADAFQEDAFPKGSPRGRQLEEVAGHVDLREEIVAFWRHDEHRASENWRDHQNINQVMLATGLAPHERFLGWPWRA